MSRNQNSAPVRERSLLEYHVELSKGTKATAKAFLHEVAVPALIPHTAPKACSTEVADPSLFVKFGLHDAGALLIGGLSLSPLFQKIFST